MDSRHFDACKEMVTLELMPQRIIKDIREEIDWVNL